MRLRPVADDLQQRVDQAFNEASRAHDIDERWLRAIAKTESGGALDRVSPAGAAGLMQIMPDTARRLGIDPQDPVQAIHGAARLLDENLKRYGNPVDAMRAYNAGTDRTRWDNDETRAYPEKVMATMATVKQRKSDPAHKVLGDDIYGWQDDAPPSPGKAAPHLDDSIYGWAPDTAAPARAAPVAPKQSGLQETGTFVNDTVNAAGREIDRTGAGVSRLLGYLSSFGHHLDNPVSRAATHAADAIDGAEDRDEASRQGDYGARYSNMLGTTAGALLASEMGGRAVRPAAKMLDGTRGGRIVSNVLTGNGPASTRWANNALAAGSQAALAGDDWQQAATTAGLLSAGGSVVKGLTKGAGGVRSIAGRVGDYLDPVGAAERGESALPTPGHVAEASEAVSPVRTQSVAEQKAQSAAQQKAVSRIGAFTSPQKAADAIVKAFSSPDGTGLYEAQVPGVLHTTAVRTRDVKMAGLEDNMRDLYPDAFRVLDSANGDAYVRHLRETIGTPEHIDNLEAERKTFEQEHRESAFANEQAVPVGNLHAVLDGHIRANAGNEAVSQAIAKAKDALSKVTFSPRQPDPTHTIWNTPADPQLWANPSDLWNVRKGIGYGLQQAAASESSHMRAAASRLSPFMDDLAESIDKGAPGFHDYLQGYSARSGKIDSLRFLQSRGLTQAANDAPTGEAVNYTALKKLVGQIDKNEVSVRQTGTDSITPDQESRLRMVYRDMLAEREMQAAGRSQGGSKTFKAGMTQRAKEIRGGNIGAMLTTGGALLGGHEGGMLAGGIAGTALHTGNALLGHALANRRATNMEQADQYVINHLLGR